MNILKIQSNFWLPSWSDDNQDIESGAEYLNGYIGLKNVNLAAIVDRYLG